MKAALYARVSSERQAERDLSIAAQLKALRKYAGDKGWEIHREYVDEAESARSANRPAFQEMIGEAKRRSRPFDVILVWKLSRFARNREDSIIYKSLLRRRGISVVSINEQIDASPAGKLLEGIIEVIDEFYSTNLAQDTIRGMKENVSRGFYNGGTPPIGYQATKVKVGTGEKRKLTVDENYAPVVRRVFGMYLNGMGAKEIVNILNGEGLRTNRGKSWSKTLIYYILTNEVYTGTLVWNKLFKHSDKRRPKPSEEIMRIKGCHPAIIDERTFCRAQELLKERNPNAIHPRRLGSDYLLSSLLYCGKCGNRMLGCAAKSSKHFYYACQNYLKRGKNVCSAKLVNRDRLERFVIERIKANILSEENLAELAEMVNDELEQSKGEYEERLATLDRQSEDLRARLDRLYTVLETGKIDVDTIAPKIKELRNQIDELTETRVDLTAKMRDTRVEFADTATVKGYVEDLRELLSTGSVMEQKSFLRSFIRRIQVDLPQVTIDYTIPMDSNAGEPSTLEVLSMVQRSSPGRIRTSNPPVNSRTLYR